MFLRRLPIAIGVKLISGYGERVVWGELMELATLGRQLLKWSVIQLELNRSLRMINWCCPETGVHATVLNIIRERSLRLYTWHS
jgi:hypothetical protein